MKISCIQMNVKLNSPNENLTHIKELIKDSLKKSPDVIVLPEMWNVGFSPLETVISLCDNNGLTVKKEISSLAREFNVNIVAGSVANIIDAKLYNTCYVFDRTGNTVAEYNKTHLFSPMGEDKVFTKGNKAVSFNLDGVSCTVIICYDLRFPELVRTVTTNVPTDILFAVAQWPTQRINHLKALTVARSIENQMFTVCCNTCSKTDKVTFGGNSLIVNPQGEILAQAKENEEIITANCNLTQIKEIRSSINVFNDINPVYI